MLRKCVVSLEQVRKKARPEINQHLRQMNQGIASVLQDSQKSRWKKYEKQLMGQLQGNQVRRPVSTKQLSRQSKPTQTQSDSKPEPATE